MSPSTRDAKKQAKIRQRRRHQARERLDHDRLQAQQAAKACKEMARKPHEHKPNA